MPFRRSIDDPYFDHKIYHFAAKFALDGSGRVSALCYKRPRGINLDRGYTWTITESAVTCLRCRRLLREPPAADPPDAVA